MRPKETKLATALAALAAALALCGCGRPGQKVARRLAILKAQAAVPQRKEFKGSVVCVETRGFFRGYPSRHNYHWNNNGETLYLIGEAMGRAMAKLLDNRK